jgi:hypothetical protein
MGKKYIVLCRSVGRDSYPKLELLLCEDAKMAVVAHNWEFT